MTSVFKSLMYLKKLSTPILILILKPWNKNNFKIFYFSPSKIISFIFSTTRNGILISPRLHAALRLIITFELSGNKDNFKKKELFYFYPLSLVTRISSWKLPCTRLHLEILFYWWTQTKDCFDFQTKTTINFVIKIIFKLSIFEEY